MLNQMPALIAVRQAAEREILSARPDAPVVLDVAAETAPRTYRTRAALASSLARIADLVAPRDWVPAHRAAPSR
jgi:lipid A disaccharide synthetase